MPKEKKVSEYHLSPVSATDTAENQVSIKDGKLEKHFQIAEKENKELVLSYFIDSKMSIFSQ